MDEGFLKLYKSFAYNEGSTAVMCLLVGDRLFCLNVGDSRALLSRNKEAILLSRDHKPVVEIYVDRPT